MTASGIVALRVFHFSTPFSMTKNNTRRSTTKPTRKATPRRDGKANRSSGKVNHPAKNEAKASGYVEPPKELLDEIHSRSSRDATVPDHLFKVDETVRMAAEISQVVKETVPEASTSLIEEVVRSIECICIGVTAMSMCDSNVDYGFHFAQMLHNLYGKSLMCTVGEMFGALNVSTPQVKRQDTSGDPPPDPWIITLRSMLSDWDTFASSSAANLGKKIMALVASITFCKAEEVEFSLTGLTAFGYAMEVADHDMSDIFSLAISTLQLLVNQGYQCFQLKSWKPLLYDEDKLSPILQKITECEKFMALYERGSLETMAFLDEQALAKLFEETICDVKELLRVTRSMTAKKVLQDKLHRLTLSHSDFTSMMTQGGLKIAPFCVGLFGGSSVGKSSLAALVMATCLRSMGVDCDDTSIIAHNPHDKFMSTVKNSTTGVNIDEIGQIKSGFVSEPDIIPFLQMNNNAKFYANVAEAHMKGKISPAPYCVVTTKNVKDNGASEYVNEPLAVVRREHVIITTKVRPAYATGGMLDPKKVRADFKDELIPDVWSLTIEKVVALPEAENKMQGKNVLKTNYTYVPFDYGGKLYVDVGVQEVLDILSVLAREHLDFQRQLVANSRNIGPRLPFCDEHKCFHHRCPEECSLEQQDEEEEEEEEEELTASDVSSLSQSNVPEPRKWSWFSGGEEPSSYFTKLKPKSWGTMSAKALAGISEITEASSFLAGADLSKVMADSETQMFIKKNPKWEAVKLAFSSGTALSVGQYCVSHAFDTFWGKYGNRLDKDMDKFFTAADSKGVFEWYSWIPDEYIHNQWIMNAAVTFHHATPRCRRTCQFLCLCLIWYWYHSIYMSESPQYLVLITCFLWWSWKKVWTYCDYCAFLMVKARIVRSRSQSPTLVKYIRGEYSHLLVNTTIIITILEILRRVYIWQSKTEGEEESSDAKDEEQEEDPPMAKKAIAAIAHKFSAKEKSRRERNKEEPKVSEPHAFVPKNDEEVETKNDQQEVMETIAREHNWTKPFVAQLPCTEKAITTTTTQLLGLVEKNLLEMRITDSITGMVSRVNILMIGHNVGLTTNHSCPEVDSKAFFSKVHCEEGETSSANFSCWIGPQSYFKIGDDAALVFVPKGGTWKNLVDYFPDVYVHKEYGHLVYRNDSPPQRGKYSQAEMGSSECGFGTVQCVHYLADVEPVSGMCGAPFITEGYVSSIVGIHQSGVCGTKNGKRIGNFVPVSRKQLQDALADLSCRFFLPMNSGTLVTECYGKQILENQKMHAKSCLRSMPHGSHFEFLGSCIGRASFHPTVHLLPSCRYVEEEFDVKCEWRNPSIPDPYGSTMQYIGTCSDGIEPEFFCWAQEDYLEQLERMYHEMPNLVASVRSLTDDEALNGIDGVRFVDKMDFTTSPGLGLDGKKRDHILTMVSEDGTEVNIPKAEVMAEMSRMEAAWLREERCYPLFKACLKDEPVDKPKCRAFMCGQMAFSLLVRKYLAMTIRAFQMSLEHSECCVGMNPNGPDWHEWKQWHEEYSAERIFDGDYSKWDLRQAAMLCGGTAFVWMEWMRGCPNVTSRDLCMVRGIFTEIMYPVVCLNGDMIQAFGMSPSGIPITVTKNSSDNSIILRCAAKFLNPKLERFRDAAKLGTYGDDCKAGVHEDHQYFNAIQVAPAMARWGYKFTPADKSENFVQWNPNGDFLKMTDSEVEGTGCIIGALAPKSLLKPLLVGTKSSLAPLEQVQVNIDGSLRDAFNHGRQYYESHREKVTRVAERLDIVQWCTELPVSYDEALERWKERYADRL